MAGVSQLPADPRVTVHKAVEPLVKVTVPVAPAGNPVSDSVTGVPYATRAGEAETTTAGRALMAHLLAGLNERGARSVAGYVPVGSEPGAVAGDETALPEGLRAAGIALLLSLLLRRLLAAFGFYRFVWHRALFDLALTVILLGGTVEVASRVFGP